MRIAVIEDDLEYSNLLKDVIKKQANSKWTVDYFNNSADFGEAKLSEYQIIISDYKLPTINGLDLFRTIANKTEAALALMSGHDVFREEKEVDDFISRVFDKKNIKEIVDWFQYTEAKLRINNMVEQEKESLTKIALVTNGHTVEIKNGIVVLGVSRTIDIKSDEYLQEIFEKGKYKIVAYFMNKRVNSTQLSFLIQIHKLTEKKGGKLVFWNKDEDKFVSQVLRDCALDKVLTIFGEEEIAVKYLQHLK